MIERYEFKYLIDESVVADIQRTALSVGHRDPYAGPDGSYSIRSLYLDTPGNHLYWANDRQEYDRFKARVRAYPGKPGPTFFEIKRRTGDVIRKTRGVVTGDWQPLARGDFGVTFAPRSRAALEGFVERTLRYHLEPTQLVQYEREAFASAIDSYARLTIDRKLVGQATREWTLEANERRWRPIDVGLISEGLRESCAVLELKFERRPPRWMVAMVRRLGLERKSFSKYGHTVETQLRQPERREPSPAR
jgi:VTC domain